MRRAAQIAWQALRRAKPAVVPVFAALGAASVFHASAFTHSPPEGPYAHRPAVEAEENYEEGVPSVSC